MRLGCGFLPSHNLCRFRYQCDTSLKIIWQRLLTPCLSLHNGGLFLHPRYVGRLRNGSLWDRGRETVEECLSCTCGFQEVGCDQTVSYLSFISSGGSGLPSAHVQRLCPLQWTLVTTAPPPPPPPVYALTRCKNSDVWKLLESSCNPQPCPLVLLKAGGLRLDFPSAPAMWIQPFLFALCSLPLVLWGRGQRTSFLYLLMVPTAGTRGLSLASGARGGHVKRVRSFRDIRPPEQPPARSWWVHPQLVWPQCHEGSWLDTIPCGLPSLRCLTSPPEITSR